MLLSEVLPQILQHMAPSLERYGCNHPDHRLALDGTTLYLGNQQLQQVKQSNAQFAHAQEGLIMDG